jgi:hypothetical protein
MSTIIAHYYSSTHQWLGDKLILKLDMFLENNFATLLRLAHKYQVASLIAACEYYIITDLNKNGSIKLDILLTLLIASIDYHLSRTAIEQLVMQFANVHDRAVYARLKLNHLLPTKVKYRIIPIMVLHKSIYTDLQCNRIGTCQHDAHSSTRIDERTCVSYR